MFLVRDVDNVLSFPYSVSVGFQCGDEALSRLTRSRDYSPVFQIILNSKDLISSMPGELILPWLFESKISMATCHFVRA